MKSCFSDIKSTQIAKLTLGTLKLNLNVRHCLKIRLTTLSATMSAAKEIPPAEKETELPSAHYGEREETDPVTKEQIEKILGEREEQLLEIIQDSST